MTLNDQEYRLTLITPMFCAGTDQRVAELRAPSIRGEWRWWFRALGGERAEEESVFGAPGDDSRAKTSSRVSIRVANLEKATQVWNPQFSQSYLTHFLKAPNKNIGNESRMWTRAPDSRNNVDGQIRSKAQIPPGSSFKLIISTRGRIPDNALPLYNLSLSALLHLGTLGFRATRGFGAWCCENPPETAAQLKPKVLGRGFFWNETSDPLHSLNDIMSRLDSALKQAREEFPAARPSTLGSTEGGRQRSAVRFRPMPSDDGGYHLAVVEAPSNRVLEHGSRHPRSPTFPSLNL